jgi:hypothetical protein
MNFIVAYAGRISIGAIRSFFGVDSDWITALIGMTIAIALFVVVFVVIFKVNWERRLEKYLDGMETSEGQERGNVQEKT